MQDTTVNIESCNEKAELQFPVSPAL